MLVGISVFFWTVSRVGLKDWNCLKRRDFLQQTSKVFFFSTPKSRDSSIVETPVLPKDVSDRFEGN